MSYDSDPNLYGFSTPPINCIVCHPLNQSPDQLQIAFAGIERGDTWLATDPPPPNGVFEILAIGPCAWQAVIGNYTISLTYGPLLSLLSVVVPGPVTVFTKLWILGCNVWFPNTIINPVGNDYYGGWGSVSIPQVAVTDSVPTLMDSIGIPAAQGTAVSPRPLTADQTVYVFARTSDASNVHVKITHT